MKNEYILCAVIIFGIAIFVWSLTSMMQTNSVGGSKFNYYQNQNLQTGSECGDMTDPANVQHLSHHPDRFGDCIKNVDPQIFEQSVGQKKEDYIKANGIQ